jgi:hypothetical protein
VLTKLDLRKDLKRFYSPSAKVFSFADIPPMNFLMIDGSGDPNTSPEYVAAIEALYALAYTIKFTVKKQQQIDYPVMPLEGLWWSRDMASFGLNRRNDWLWTMMIMQPGIVSHSLVLDLVEEVRKKKNLPDLSKVRLECYAEGLAAQILYYGAYKDEGPTIQHLHEYIRENKCELSGKHHEIYLGDPRRTLPEKLKTVIRQPARRVLHQD